jgi:hypothetical protein
MLKCTPRLIYVEHIIWCAFEKVMNERWHLDVHFEYVVMPFDLTNMLVVSQHLMNNVFHEYYNDFMICYIDDILIFSKNIEGYERHLH